MKEQNQRQIQNQTELDERRLRQNKLVRKRKIVLSVMLLTSFLLGCVCGRYFPEIKLGKTEEVLASAQDNSDEEKKENQITIRSPSRTISFLSRHPPGLYLRSMNTWIFRR